MAFSVHEKAIWVLVQAHNLHENSDVEYRMTEASNSIRLKAESLSEGLHDNERLSTVLMLLK